MVGFKKAKRNGKNIEINKKTLKFTFLQTVPTTVSTEL